MHALDASLYAPLQARPQATTITVRELIQRTAQGRVRVPRFQRPLRWRRDDVIELLDSVWRGYPIGSLLFWKREASAEAVTIGAARVPADAFPDAWWLVDGQQRTVALAASLLELNHGDDRRWNVIFDPDKAMFGPGPVSPGREGRDVPVSVLGDLRRLGRWIRESELDDRDITRLEDIQQRILDYPIPAYVVETGDERALRAVFARLNSSGAKMRADEVFQALLGAVSGDVDRADLDRLQRETDVDGFGVAPRAELLKALLAMSGHDPSARLTDFLTAPNIVGASAARDAVLHTVRFLREDAGIPHISLIPYPVTFVLLARWFHLHPEPAPETRSRLAHWVWRGAQTGVHQRAAVSAMREQAREIDQDEEASIRRLLGHVQRSEDRPWELKRFNLKSARSRIEVLAMLEEGPRDEFGPIRVAELIEQGRVAREIFRAADWNAGDESLVRRARSAANRVLHGGPTTGLSVQLTRLRWPEDRERLCSHLIQEEGFKDLAARDIGGFLERRAKLVRDAVERLLLSRCAWEEPTVGPLESYLER